MTAIATIAGYLGISVLVIASIARFLMWRRLPMHVRWELYPVAHEGERARYGGSYLENGEWWKKPRESSMVGELKVMVPEILFLVAVKENNPELWKRSFPFHFGLYLVAGCTALLFAAGALGHLAPRAMEGTLGLLFHWAILVTGVAGLTLGLIGAAGLLGRRLTVLRDYSAPADIWNLVFFIVVFGFAFVTWAWVDPSFEAVGALVANLVAFDLRGGSELGAAGMMPALSLILMSALVAYIPLTHMSHFIGKYFAYHAIRWNDTPNLQGGKEEPVIGELLNRPVRWSAPHIRGDGKRTWGQVCTEEEPE